MYSIFWSFQYQSIEWENFVTSSQYERNTLFDRPPSLVPKTENWKKSARVQIAGRNEFCLLIGTNQISQTKILKFQEFTFWKIHSWKGNRKPTFRNVSNLSQNYIYIWDRYISRYKHFQSAPFPPEHENFRLCGSKYNYARCSVKGKEFEKF